MIKRIILYTIILVAARAYQLSIPNSALRHSYISSINCPVLGTNTVKNYIDNFNQIGNNVVIKFDKDTRPITIKEFKPTKDQDYLLGYTYVRKANAEIYLSKNLKKNQVKQVLIHELCHGYGYDHVKTPGDLMYPYIDNNEDYSLEYVKYYWKLHKLIYGK